MLFRSERLLGVSLRDFKGWICKWGLRDFGARGERTSGECLDDRFRGSCTSIRVAAKIKLASMMRMGSVCSVFDIAIWDIFTV